MKRIVCALVAHALVACAGTGKPYALPLPEYDRTRYREVGHAEGYAVGRLISIIPLGKNDTIERATKLAIEANQGDAITDVTVTQRYSISPIFVSNGVKVRGLVLRKIRPGDPPESDYERGRREERERIERERR